MGKAMSAQKEIYALFGDPVGHSLSPLMHRAAYEAMGIGALYIPFRVADIEAAVRGIRGLDIRGVSVTLPFKTQAMAWLDSIDEAARAVGAVNTIVNRNGRLEGFNTDWSGLAEDLGECMVIQGKTFAVLGAGGAARAALYAIVREEGRPFVISRSRTKGEALAAGFGCPWQSLTEIGRLSADCLINATPVGMAPAVEQTPLPGLDLSRFAWVVDLIYNPLKSKLLAQAEAAGCFVRSGLGMFVHQGAQQIRLWTGLEPPLSVMREVVLETLKADDRNKAC
ncbi:MAG: shikimate dehydrogenase [Deltaproteobacteria bacterium]|nr:shikimate dehydrogenase [Deltaproteobacteria bacterium]